MAKISSQTKSFIILFVVAFFGVLLCLKLWSGLIGPNYYYTSQQSAATPNQPAAAAMPVVDTSNWQTYSNKQLGLSFKYRPDWKILPPTTKGGWTLLQVDPGKKYYNIKIYVSSNDFYIMGGLPAQSQTIGGAPALNVNNALYGIRANNFYYTFDVGLSMSLVPDFNGLVKSVNFGG